MRESRKGEGRKGEEEGGVYCSIKKLNHKKHCVLYSFNTIQVAVIQESHLL